MARFVDDLEVQRRSDIGLPRVSRPTSRRPPPRARLLLDERLVATADGTQSLRRFDACLDLALGLDDGVAAHSRCLGGPPSWDQGDKARCDWPSVSNAGSHVPHQCLYRARAPFVQETTWAVGRLPPRCSRAIRTQPGFDVVHSLSTSSEVHFRSPSRSMPDEITSRLFPSRSAPRH